MTKKISLYNVGVSTPTSLYISKRIIGIALFVLFLAALCFPNITENSVYATNSMLPSEVSGWEKSGEQGVSGDWAWIWYGDYDDNDQKVNRFYITGYKGSATSVTVPDVLDGREVYGVYGGPDEDFKTIKNITFSKGLKMVGPRTFEFHPNLETVAFESNSMLKAIGEAAFYGCENLSTLNLPNDLEEISCSAFDGCYNLSNITLPANLNPFYSYTPYREVQDSFLGAEDYSSFNRYFNPFNRSQNINFNIPKDSKNYKLVDGNLYSKDGSVLYYRKKGATNLSFSIPSGVKHIADYAFVFDEGLTGVTLPSELETIGENAFNSTGITSLTIPDSVSFIDSYAFAYCNSLTKVKIGKSIKDLQKNGATHQFYGCSALYDLALSEGLERISFLCFGYCSSLQSVNIPNSLKVLSHGAFGECSSLQTVNGATGLTKISSQAFYRCKIVSFPFGNKLEIVSGKAFQLDDVFDNNYPSYLKSGDLDGDGIDDYYLGSNNNLLVKGSDEYSLAYQVLTLVNQERSRKGLDALVMDSELLESAMQRSAELTARFSHTRPSGATCFSISKLANAENIAIGNTTAASVMNSWMNSSGHKANILANSSKSIGVGCFISNGIYYWVQLFGSESPESVNKTGSEAKNREVELIPSTYLPSLVLTVEQKEVCLGETLSVKALIHDSEDLSMAYFLGEADVGSFTWNSLDSSIASVDSRGMIKGNKKGTVIVNATFPGTEMSAKITVKVAGLKINDATVTGVDDKKYTGKAIEQKPTVTLKNKILTEGIDYTLSFKNNINPGEATITIKGKGEYEGSKNVEFNILPSSLQDQKGVGQGTSIVAANAAITSMKNDNDPTGTVFRTLKLRSLKQTKKAIILKWNKPKGVKKYMIYGNACGKNNRMKKLVTTTKNLYNAKMLKKGTYYKFIVVALDRNNNVVSTSKVIHVATKGGKVGNNKSVSVSKKVIVNAKNLKKGNSLKLNAKAVAQSKKLKVKKHRAISYESSNPKIASVSKKGVVKAIKKGACYVYSYAQNGTYKRIRVVVK